MLAKLTLKDDAVALLNKLGAIGYPVIEICNVSDDGKVYSALRLDDASLDHKQRRKLKKHLKNMFRDIKAKIPLTRMIGTQRFYFMDLPFLPDGRYLLSSLSNTPIITPSLKLPEKKS